MNTGLICSCTLAFKPFFNRVASSRFFNHPSSSPALTLGAKTHVPLRAQSDSGPLVRLETGGRGFVVLGDGDDGGTEMSGSNAGAVEVEYDV